MEERVYDSLCHASFVLKGPELVGQKKRTGFPIAAAAARSPSLYCDQVQSIKETTAAHVQLIS